MLIDVIKAIQFLYFEFCFVERMLATPSEGADRYLQ